MSFGKKILPFIVGSALTYGVCVGFNAYNHHNVEINDHGNRTFEKIDGAFSYTSLEFRGDKLTLDNRSLNYQSFDDNNADGKVDKIFLGSNPFVRGSFSRFFYRESDFKDNSKIFEEADRELKEQLDRFGLDLQGNRIN